MEKAGAIRSKQMDSLITIDIGRAAFVVFLASTALGG